MSNNLGTTHCGIVLNCFLYFYLSLSPSVSLIHIHMDMNNIKKKKKTIDQCDKIYKYNQEQDTENLQYNWGSLYSHLPLS